jgi:hypothetical protein
MACTRLLLVVVRLLELRQQQADRLYDVMTDMVFRTSAIDRTLFQSLLDARHIHGRGHKVVEDIARNPTSLDRIVMGSFILGRRMAEMTPGQTNVAVLLPNSIGCLLTFFGLHAFGRVPAMLNFSTGAVNMAAACKAAQATTIQIGVVEDNRADRLLLSVEDNGVGMNADMIARVVDPFVTSRTTRKVGLGIPLLKAAAACHNGMATFAEAGVSSKDA